MTYVLKVPVEDIYDRYRMIFGVSKATPNVVQVLELNPADGSKPFEHSCNIKSNYHFNDENHVDMFLHIIKQIMMFGRHYYFRYTFEWKNYRECKQHPISNTMDYYPNSTDNNARIQEMYLTSESDFQRLFYIGGILSQPYSYALVVDEKWKTWCMGWNNQDEDIERYVIPGRYKILTLSDILIQNLSDILLPCLLMNLNDKKRTELEQLMPGFSKYWKDKQSNPNATYPYETLPTTSNFFEKFRKWYIDSARDCTKCDGLEKWEVNPRRRCVELINYNICSDSFGGKFPAYKIECLQKYFRDYDVYRSNRREKYRQEQGIKR